MAFRTLAHHIDVEFLRVAYEQTRKDGAVGVDDQTAADYATDLEGNLQSLLDRFKSGTYRAPPVRRVEIPKPDGTTRPIGIPTFEDKVLQRAVVMVLNAVYEQDFLDCSYGFRPGRSAHQAIESLWKGLMGAKGGWVIDLDIRHFFDSVDHRHLRAILDQRVRDGVIRRSIDKWLKAGVQQDGGLWHPDSGTPQGGVISPLLANIYLHYVFDLWAHRWRKRLANGDVIIVRYADDFVVGFQHEADARRFLADLRGRLRKFSLELHEDKSRLLRFGRFAAQQRKALGEGKPETFDFLGFTHICGKSKRGKFLLRRQTIAKRMRATLAAVKQGLRRRMHASTASQGEWLRKVVDGWLNYHAVPTNSRRLDAFKLEVKRLWYLVLRRRSQTPRKLWTKVFRLAQHWLPSTRIRHPWPTDRFDAMTRGRSRVR
jgi:group II intron reverse transcriptase/maturase